jgi:magnesium chelatase subunit D
MDDAVSSAPSPWADACATAVLLAIDPVGLGGVALRSQAGPVRERWTAWLRELFGGAGGAGGSDAAGAAVRPGAPGGVAPPLRRVPLHIQDERLLGGLDLSATLQAGRPIAQRGVLAEADGGVVLLAMAERLSAAAAGRIVAVMDRGEVVVERDGVALRSPARFGVVAFDEGLTDDEGPPVALLDRLAFRVDLDSLPPDESRHAAAEADGADLSVALAASGDLAGSASAREVVAARNRLPQVRLDDASTQALCAAAMALGIPSLRASLFAVRAACAAAAWSGRDNVSVEDIGLAARLVLAPRATMLPAAPPPPDEAPPDERPAPDAPDAPADGESPNDPPVDPPPTSPEPAPEQTPEAPSEPPTEADPPTAPQTPQPLEDQILEAVQAAIPAGLLALLRAGDVLPSRQRAAGRAGARQQGSARGRPAGARRGEPRAGARLNVIETLRAAVPWQKLRQLERAKVQGQAQALSPAGARRIEVRQQDFHVSRTTQRTETTIIFVVDASGSSAMNRLAEAKGAVELLLADCYVRRDRVAVMAFRGRGAELLLPPTRSLVRAKRSLAGLPGGGGTPLAHALDAAAALADSIARRGESPLLVLLTDGRANIGRDGNPGRAQAEQDALAAARQLRLQVAACAVLLVDTSPQPQPQAQRLATALQARYLALPYAGAAVLNQAVRAGAAANRR